MEEGLDPDTIVNMADGQYLSLKEVKKGDEVFSYDFKSKDFKPSKVTKVKKVDKKTFYRIRAKEEIFCSSGFKIILSDGKSKTAKAIKQGNKIINEYGQEEEVVDIEKIEKPLTVLNLAVKDGSFVAGGFVVSSD